MSGMTAGPSAPSALLTFGARNVRSYWDDVHFSLVGTRLSDTGILRRLSVAGTRTPVGVLPAAGIFGANASGKSTVLRAMADMRAVVVGSFRQGDRQSKIHRRPFLLHEAGAERPSRFDVDLVLEGVRWQYGFEIDDQRVLGEYAYYYPKGRQALVLRREEGDRLQFGPTFRSSGHTLARLARSNALLLSVAGAASDDSTGGGLEITSSIGPLYSWFRSSLRLMEPQQHGAAHSGHGRSSAISGGTRRCPRFAPSCRLGHSRHGEIQARSRSQGRGAAGTGVPHHHRESRGHTQRRPGGEDSNRRLGPD